jgi:hypothetical protein
LFWASRDCYTQLFDNSTAGQFACAAPSVVHANSQEESYVKATSRIAITSSRSGAARNQRRAAATRDASLTSTGSGAPSRRPRMSVFAFAAALLALAVLAASASASKTVIDYFGTHHQTFIEPYGGEFSEPGGIAVNASGAGPANPGDTYVVDNRFMSLGRSSSRIERFDSTGAFVSSWGGNATHRNEVQELDVNGEAEDTYTLTFEGQTTVPISDTAPSEAIKNALTALSAVGPSNVIIERNNSGEPYFVTFVNGLAGTDVPQLTPDPGAPSVNVKTLDDGSGGGGTNYEICSAAASCGGGASLGGNGTAAGNGDLDSPQGVAVDEDTGNVYVSDRNNHRIDEYEGTGAFIRAFGFDVVESGPDNAGTGYEVCVVANGDVCKAGVAGSGAGQVGSINENGSLGIAVSPPDGNPATGTVFLADTGNRRVDTYALDGTSPSSFGSSANFEAGQPRKIAVDSRGIVYVPNSSNGGEVERYDSLNANGGGTIFLAPITATNSSPAGPLLAGLTESIAVDPDTDGAGPDTDVLYVMRRPAGGSDAIQQFGPVNKPGLAAPPAAVDETQAQTIGFKFITGGLSLNQAGRLYVATREHVTSNPSFGGSGVYVLADPSSLPAPGVTVNPVAEKDQTTATLSASVSPRGGRSAANSNTPPTRKTGLSSLRPPVNPLPPAAASRRLPRKSPASTRRRTTSSVFPRRVLSSPTRPSPPPASSSSTPIRRPPSSVMSVRSRSPTPQPGWSALSTRATRPPPTFSSTAPPRRSARPPLL